MASLYKTTVIVLFTAMTSGCFGGSLVNTNSREIRPGMSLDELLITMGKPPIDRQFHENKQALQWCDRSGFGHWAVRNYVLVWVVDNRVVGTRKHSDNWALYSCIDGIKSIDWFNAPDRVIEVHQR